jgi:hypothetical protein
VDNRASGSHQSSGDVTAGSHRDYRTQDHRDASAARYLHHAEPDRQTYNAEQERYRAGDICITGGNFLPEVAKADLFRVEGIPVGPALLKPVFRSRPARPSK